MGYDTHKSEVTRYSIKYVNKEEKRHMSDQEQDSRQVKIRKLDDTIVTVEKILDQISEILKFRKFDALAVMDGLGDFLDSLKVERNGLVENRDKFLKDLGSLFKKYKASLTVNSYNNWTGANLKILLNSETVLEAEIEDNDENNPLDLMEYVKEVDGR